MDVVESKLTMDRTSSASPISVTADTPKIVGANVNILETLLDTRKQELSTITVK
jgi:hypothetical protein